MQFKREAAPPLGQCPTTQYDSTHARMEKKRGARGVRWRRG